MDTRQGGVRDGEPEGKVIDEWGEVQRGVKVNGRSTTGAGVQVEL